MTYEIYLQETFVKIREQAKAYFEMAGKLMTGINLINRTNLECFPCQHQAEIIRLKGEYFQKMNDGDRANDAYSSAIGLSRNLSKGWISWGNYCDQVIPLFVIGIIPSLSRGLINVAACNRCIL